MLKNIINLIKTTFVRMTTKQQINYKTWIFSSSFNEKFNYNSKYLFEYVLQNEPSITPVFVINDDKLRKKLKEKYGKKYFVESKSIIGIKKILNSGVWFTSAGLPVYGLKLNKKRLIINLWHGVPIKKIALMENKQNPLAKAYFKHIFSNNYTYILTTSKKMIPIMSESFAVPKAKIKVWGQPRNDMLFISNDKSTILNRLYGDLPNYKHAILYAPTYRDDSETEFFPFEDMDYKELNDFLNEEEIIIFIRSHQSEKSKMNNHLSDRVKLINEDKIEDIMDIINVFDLLITDYSSIYIDFSITEKPVMFLPYDRKKYFENRGVNFEYDQITPGPKVKEYQGFKDEIKLLLYNTKYYKKERLEVKEIFNEINTTCSSHIVNKVKKRIS